jgi:hypothetical protein
MSVSMKESYETAMRAARESDEVLRYGRVFPESIDGSHGFSAGYVGFTWLTYETSSIADRADNAFGSPSRTVA